MKKKKAKIKYLWYKPTYLSKNDPAWQKRFKMLQMEYKNTETAHLPQE